MEAPPQTSSKFSVLGSIDDLHVSAGITIAREPWPFIDTTGSEVIIGPHVVLSAGVYIHTHSHQFEKENWRHLPKVKNRTPTCIEDRAFIGTNAQIMHTCKYIGKCSVIAAGAIVTRDVGDYEIWAGNPAKKIGTVERTVENNIHRIGRNRATAS